jgi:hypothetical protein
VDFERGVGKPVKMFGDEGGGGVEEPQILRLRLSGFAQDDTVVAEWSVIGSSRFARMLTHTIKPHEWAPDVSLAFPVGATCLEKFP